MTIKENIEVLLAPLLEDGDCYLVDIVTKPSKLSQKISILVDSDEGITIQQCTSISRRLAKQLEELDLITEAYTLEVSSPGLDQPLVLPRQYKKNVGRNLKVTLKTGEVISGALTDASEEEINIKLPLPKKKSKTPVDESLLERKISLDEIAKALVEISFK
ncbi:Ribosome maturation factor RimP [Dyadobacter sp. CECT 9623]|uniref:Ribosome maturation factor RimP n=1 Tax=Dyadobacter linearis TaxID=2823330 RepID=A0ABN7RB50_9BACT|nr:MULTISPECIES: ribosome maturation factor RimP [unclassified Dyadobacter]MCE7059683.1 ribosome maturation factor RimP [Dyadobacter sp. CY343]CAG5072032.1 Ribosome maturation factor RimP [Dyadobacter sp. CECT 9623]